MYSVTIKIYFGAGRGFNFTTSVIASSKEEAEKVALKEAINLRDGSGLINRKLEVIKCEEI